jgi:hypothetical protein
MFLVIRAGFPDGFSKFQEALKIFGQIPGIPGNLGT